METVNAPSEEPKAAERAHRRSSFREVPWRWSDVLIGFAPLVAVDIAARLLGPTWLSIAPRWAWLPATLLGMIWMLAYPLWIARLRGIGSPHVPRPRAFLTEVLWTLLVLPAIMLVTWGVIMVLVSLFGESAIPTRPLEPVLRSPNRVDWLGLIILAVSLGPVAEEVLFRGMLYNALRRRLPTIVAAPLQAVVFGFMHPFGLSDVAAIIVLGLSIAVVYEWRKTLVAPVLLHALINAVGLAVMAAGIAADANAPRLGVYGERDEGGCRVTQIVPGGAADTAGLHVGDVVTALDGRPVADILEMAQIVRGKRLGDKVLVDFTRAGAARRVEAVLKPLGQSVPQGPD